MAVIKAINGLKEKRYMQYIDDVRKNMNLLAESYEFVA